MKEMSWTGFWWNIHVSAWHHAFWKTYPCRNWALRHRFSKTKQNLISFFQCLSFLGYLRFLTASALTLCVFSILGSFFPAIKPPDTLFKITFWLGYLNSCINPIIYPCSSQEFKKAFQNVLRAQCLPRNQAAKKQPPSFNLNHPTSQSMGSSKGVVRIPVGSGETFYKISRSDGVCEWKVFSTVQSVPARTTVSKDCTAAKAKSKGFLQECCCAGASGHLIHENCTVPTIKIHSISLSENGEDV